MTLEVRVDCDAGCFDLPEWRALLERDPDSHVFATPEWQRMWWEEFGESKRLQILSMWRGGDLAGIVPLYLKQEEERGVLRFVGGIDLTDYLGPICALEDRAEVADSLVGWLGDTDLEWDELDAHNLPVPFGFAEYLAERVDRRGLPWTLDQEETSAVLPLPHDWDSYLAGLSSKNRHELKRKLKRIEREHPDASLRTSTEESLEGDLKMFVDMHRGTEGMKGHFMRSEIATFFERVAHAFMPLGWLRLDFLEIAGRPIASTFGFDIGSTFYLYNSAYEPEAARLSPGLALVANLVREYMERGYDLFDFLRGPERYKYQLGAQPLPLNNIRVLRRPE